MNACSPPARAISSSPGRRCRWYVLPRMISAPASSTSRNVIALTAPRVPTGMNAGVCTAPCGVVRTPRRAFPSVCVTRNPNDMAGWYSDTVKRLRVGVLYGGRSGEHEVSLASAASVFAHLDRTRYEPVPIRIEKDGRWALAANPPAAMIAGEVIEQARIEAARPMREGREVHFVARPSDETILSIDRSRNKDAEVPAAVVTGLSLDVIFPMLHGPYGEDGTIQGLLELANIPYVGAGVLASAVGMDKAVMKVLFEARGLRVCPYRVVLRHEWEAGADSIAADLEKALKYPMFVKPANLGSSVGISKAKDEPGLRDAMALAGSFDRKIVIEAAGPNARAIECAVLGNDT